LANTTLRFTNKAKIVEFHGPADITLESTEAIVNAANSSLMGGGGVDGAIHRAAGPAILQECKRYVSGNGRLAAGQAMLTSGGRLPAKHVIHTVGPVYQGGGAQQAELLASCYRESIRLADDYRLRSMSFPAISTGAFGYPLHDAAGIAVTTVLQALEDARNVELVRFVLFDASALQAYVGAAETAVGKQPNWVPEHSYGGQR
jgi:O-acetyl-ADP-ribose deacetylase (regulator of RNase III)